MHTQRHGTFSLILFHPHPPPIFRTVPQETPHASPMLGCKQPPSKLPGRIQVENPRLSSKGETETGFCSLHSNFVFSALAQKVVSLPPHPPPPTTLFTPFPKSAITMISPFPDHWAPSPLLPSPLSIAHRSLRIFKLGRGMRWGAGAGWGEE